MLTIYIVSSGHHIFLRQCIGSVNFMEFDIKILLIETSRKKSDIRKSKVIADEFNLKLIELNNYRLPRVANFALKKSDTPYIMRLDADDWLEKNFIKTMISAIKNSHYDVYIPSYNETDYEGNKLLEIERDDLISVKIKDNPPHGACTIFSTKFLNKIGGYSEKYDRQDGYYIWLKILKSGSFHCVPDARFFYRQHEKNLSRNKRDLWKIRASMLSDECFSDINEISKVVIPVMEQESFFGKLILQPFLGYPTLLEYELKKLRVNCDVIVYGPKTLAKIIPKNVKLYERKIFSSDQWSDIQEEVLSKVNFANGYICVRNIEYPFVDSKYIEAAISALHMFKANCCITVQELKKDIFFSSDQGLKKMKDNPITDLDRKYRRTGGITAKRITNGIITPDNLLTSLPADTISTLRVTEMRDFEDLQRLFE